MTPTAYVLSLQAAIFSRVLFLHDKVLDVQLKVIGGDKLFKQTKATQMSFHGTVSGIGDDAFDGPSDDLNMGMKGPDGNPQPYTLWALKNGNALVLTIGASSSHPQFYLTQDQLRELAKLIVSRM